MPIIDAFVKQRQSWTALSLTRVDWRMNPSQHLPTNSKAFSRLDECTRDHSQAKSLGSCSWQPFCRPWPPISLTEGYYCTEGSFLHLQMFGGHAKGPWQSGKTEPK